MEIIGAKHFRAVVLFVALFPLSMFAQQDASYSMYMFNPVSINPAYVGSTEQMQAIGMFRKQWLRMPGAPQTSSLTFHGPLKNEHLGAGLSFVNDKVGDIQTTGMMGNFSYALKLKNSKLAFGIQAGVRNYNVNLSQMQLSQDYVFDQAFANAVSSWTFNVGSGLFWYSDKWYVGLSIPHLRNTLFQKETTSDARLKTHYFLNGGYVFATGDNIKIKPSVLVKSVGGAPLQIDLNTNVYWKDLLGVGISYRSKAVLAFMAEVKLNKNFRLAYAFDQSVNNLAGNVGATHEIIIRTDFLLNPSRSFTLRDF